MGLMAGSLVKRTKGCKLLQALALGVLASAGPWAGAGPALAIIGGQPGGPLNSAAVMVLHDRGGICTGIVVAPDVVLTAAHCLPAGAKFRVHYREQGEAVMLEPQAIVRHPQFRANAVQERTRSIDLALLRLAAPLPARFSVAALANAGTDGAGSAVTVAGFGLGREGDGTSTGTWRSARLAVVEPYGPSRILLWARGSAGTGACGGDSGGPMLDGSQTVVAVTTWSTGGAGRRCGDLTQGTLIAPQRGWVDATMARWQRQASWR
jgi:secreted trypsin-like serine protease